MAKKKTSVSRVFPAITTNPKFVEYDSLRNGDTFLWENGLWMKCENMEQEGIDLATGEMEDDMCGKMVEKVNIQVTWSRK